MTHKNLLSSTIALAIAALSTTAHAELTLGLNGSAYKSPYKAVDTEYFVFPAVSYDNEYVYFKGLGGGVYLVNQPQHELSVSARYGAHHFKPKDSDDRQLRQLDRRRSSVMAGLTYKYQADWGDVTAELQGDVSDRSSGYVADVSYGHVFNSGKLSVSPRIGAAYRDKKWNDYYYGVTGSESRKSGLNRYKADGAIQPYAQLSVSYAMTPRWIGYASAYYEHLSNEAKDSPMVDRNYVGALSAGMMYRF